MFIWLTLTDESRILISTQNIICFRECPNPDFSEVSLMGKVSVKWSDGSVHQSKNITVKEGLDSIYNLLKKPT